MSAAVGQTDTLQTASRRVQLRSYLAVITVLALIESDQCCSLKVTTLARVQGSAM